MDFWLDEKGLFDSGGQLNDLARKKKGWDPLRRATILSSWRKAKLDFGFDKMMNLSLFNLQYLIDSESNLSNPIRA